MSMNLNELLKIAKERGFNIDEITTFSGYFDA